MDEEETLRRVPLFEGLQPKQLKSLARWTTTRTYQSGQVVVNEGQIGMGLYCIQSGSVKITKRSANEEREIRSMGAGESFGEISLLDDKPRSATVTAVEPTTAVLLDKSQFIAELKTYPEIALSILPVLVGWLRDADAKIADLS
ncbi:MAG: cyclic nucleotide-binding domain-containing protein [Chloroflexota bacterium]|nr:cyclic nucleotide-binding domain-containing protein [Chloroflexota bacterium]